MSRRQDGQAVLTAGGKKPPDDVSEIARMSLMNSARELLATRAEPLLPSHRTETDQPSLRAALGCYATGVAVATTATSAGRPAGLTINSFTGLSLDPPLVLWCAKLTSVSLPAFMAADHFAINVLSATQEQLARRFAAPDPDRFAGVAWERGPRGMPLLGGRLATFICRRAEQFRGGDHLIIVGQPEEHAVAAGRRPLVFYGGGYLTRLARDDTPVPGSGPGRARRNAGPSIVLAAAAASITASQEGREPP